MRRILRAVFGHGTRTHSPPVDGAHTLSRRKKPPAPQKPGLSQRLQGEARRIIDFAVTEERERPWRIEIVLGTLVLLYFVFGTPGRAAFRPWFKVAYYDLQALPELLRVVGEATRHLLLLAFARLAMPLIAVVVLMLSVPRRRLLWLT